jgi:hypothetical protein
MKSPVTPSENGSTLVAALTTILVVSLIGAGVLVNSTTRYNATAKQVKGWKEALYAAEAAGDIGYAEARRAVFSPSDLFASARGWVQDNTATTPTWTRTMAAFGPDNSLAGKVTVDRFTEVNGNPYYRIRAEGSAKVNGLRRVTMDNRMNATTRGDNLLRKIDFFFDRFQATYGFGDALPTAAETTSNGKVLTTVAQPQVTRRVELIAVPVMPFEGAVKALHSFTGPGSAGRVDSWNSANGDYDPNVTLNPNHAFFEDSRHGNVAVNTGNFNQGNVIYGNVSTNGGNITHSNSQITGVIDNAVPLTIPPYLQPSLPPGFTYESTAPSTITPPVRYESDGVTRKTEFWYLYTANFHNITVNPVYHGSTPVETEINVVVNGNVGDITVRKGVTLKVHFKGNLNSKARDLDNQNQNGYGATTGVLMVNPNRDNDPATNDSYIPSTRTSRAGHLQFYGIQPPPGVTQRIDIGPPGDVYATFYAPAAELRMTGNPDVFGAVVVRSFHGNGNTGFHFDTALAAVGTPTEYRVAHYIEDVR